jgi:hypothetical protein
LERHSHSCAARANPSTCKTLAAANAACDSNAACDFNTLANFGGCITHANSSGCISHTDSDTNIKGVKPGVNCFDKCSEGRGNTHFNGEH